MATFIKAGFWEKRKQGYDHWLNLEEFVSNLIPPAGGVTSIIAGAGMSVSSATGAVTICNTQCPSPFTLNGVNLGIKPINGFNNSLASFSVIGGGYYNSICLFANQATISGGKYNKICTNSYYSTIGGGRGNCINSTSSTIGGGGGYSSSYPYIGNLGNYVNGSWGTIGGGACNAVSSDKGTIGGGFRNRVLSCGATVGGGIYNQACGIGSFVGGGKGAYIYTPYGPSSSPNNIASGAYSVIVGGTVAVKADAYGTYFCQQIASGIASFIGGGRGNTVSGCFSSILGGVKNNISGKSSTITGGGGYIYSPYSIPNGNIISGNRSFIGSGISNNITGNFSFIGTGGSYYSQGNTISNDLSFIGSGICNRICGVGGYNFIGTGNNNTIINSACSSILSGAYNSINSYDCVNIIGNNITADRVNTTFVNNLSIMNIPSASAGLPTGAVWKNSCVLTIV